MLTTHSRQSLADQTLASAEANIQAEIIRLLDMQTSASIRSWTDRIDQTIASAAQTEQFGKALVRTFPFIRRDLTSAATWRELVNNILHAAGHNVSLF